MKKRAREINYVKDHKKKGKIGRNICKDTRREKIKTHF
jgi:hypothetical protein